MWNLKKWFRKRDWYKQLSAPPKHTPDLWKIEQSPKALLFEYGELAQGMPHANILKGNCVGYGFTVERFNLIIKNDGRNAFPFAIRAEFDDQDLANKMPRLKVRGELYEVPYQKIIELDKLRQNTVVFIRKRIPILLPSVHPPEGRYKLIGNKEGDPQRVLAWVYVGLKDYWMKEIDWDLKFFRRRGGNVYASASIYDDRRRAWAKQYYQFTPIDLIETDKPKVFMYLLDHTKPKEIEPIPKVEDKPVVNEPKADTK